MLKLSLINNYLKSLEVEINIMKPNKKKTEKKAAIKVEHKKEEKHDMKYELTEDSLIDDMIAFEPESRLFVIEDKVSCSRTKVKEYKFKRTVGKFRWCFFYHFILRPD